MFCSSCKRIDGEIRELDRKVCITGHIYCNECDENLDICAICEMRFSKIFHIKVVENTPRIYFSDILEVFKDQNKDLSVKSNENPEIYDSDSSFIEMINELDSYDNDCNKCKENPIVGCVQVIAHKSDEFSLILDEEDEKEILKNFEKTPKPSQKCQNQKSQRSEYSSKFQSKATSFSPEDQNLVKTSCSNCYDSRIANKSSSCEGLDESHNSCLSFTTRSECLDNQDDVGTSNLNSVYQLYRNPKEIDDSDASNFTSLSALRLEASPPDENQNSQKRKNACRVKFTPVYQCDHKYPAQMEPIEYLEDEDIEDSQKLSSENVSLNLPRMPITCPCTYCEIVTTPSDFYSHITIDHPYIETIKLPPNKVINTCVCSSGNTNYVRCHQMFLLSEKLPSIGYGSFKGCLPMLLLSCKFNLREIFSLSPLGPNQKYQKSEEVLCIWLASIYEYPVDYSLNVWKHINDRSKSSFIKSISTNTSFLSTKETNLQIVTNYLCLSASEYASVKDEDNMIQCQIIFC